MVESVTKMGAHMGGGLARTSKLESRETGRANKHLLHFQFTKEKEQRGDLFYLL